jgi:hypothetical protein
MKLRSGTTRMDSSLTKGVLNFPPRYMPKHVSGDTDVNQTAQTKKSTTMVPHIWTRWFHHFWKKEHTFRVGRLLGFMGNGDWYKNHRLRATQFVLPRDESKMTGPTTIAKWPSSRYNWTPIQNFRFLYFPSSCCVIGRNAMLSPIQCPPFCHTPLRRMNQGTSKDCTFLTCTRIFSLSRVTPLCDYQSHVVSPRCAETPWACCVATAVQYRMQDKQWQRSIKEVSVSFVRVISSCHCLAHAILGLGSCWWNS